MNNEIVILGTGNALATRCYNTCFVLKSSGGHQLLVDAGGGNGIFRQMELAEIDRDSIDDVFVTHAHTDHLLGVIWVIRAALQAKVERKLRIYSIRKVLDILEYICKQTLPEKQLARMKRTVEFREVKSGDHFDVGDMQFQCFDTYSKKEPQYGFSVEMPEGLRLVCLGDEPFNDRNEVFVKEADWLMCEAFCLYEDRERFKPYEKHHSTALDAARLAESLGVRNLILYHTEDKTLKTRKQLYTKEAQSVYHGKVYVPDDLEIIKL